MIRYAHFNFDRNISLRSLTDPSPKTLREQGPGFHTQFFNLHCDVEPRGSFVRTLDEGLDELLLDGETLLGLHLHRL